MDNTKAKQLLAKIAEAKQAKFDIVGETLHNILPTNPIETNQMLNSQAKNDAVRHMLMATLIGGTSMAGLRFLSSLNEPPISKQNKVKRVVDMPIPYQAKEAEEKEAESWFDSTNDVVTTPSGLGYYYPGMITGAVGAGALSWKVMGSLLKKQRQKDIEENTDIARQEYESALQNMYKKAEENLLSKEASAQLDEAFDSLEKVARDNSILGNVPFLGSVHQVLNALDPNTYGAVKGVALANAALGLPLGYALVNQQVRKNSKRKLVDKAMKERQRLRALQSPTEINAIPTPIE